MTLRTHYSYGVLLQKGTSPWENRKMYLDQHRDYTADDLVLLYGYQEL